MKGIIIYKSKYGSTKQFAEWIKEETNFDIKNINEIKNTDFLSAYDCVVLGSFIHAWKIGISDWLIKKWDVLINKKIVLFLTSGADKNNSMAIDKFIKNSLPDNIIEKIKYFCVGGKYNVNELSFIEKTLIKIVANLSKDPNVKKGMLEIKIDFKKENIDKIVDYIKKLS